MSNTTDGRQTLNALTSLRFFAAFGVLICHVVPIITSLPQLAATAFNSLFCMVGFFFILSGFILARTYERKDFNKKGEVSTFYWKRFARIYPMYLVSLLIMVTAIKGLPATELMIGVPLRLTMLQSWTTLGQNNAQGWNGPLWSISVELLFYLLFPFLIMWLAKASSSTRWRLFWGCIFVSFASSAAFDVVNATKGAELGVETMERWRYIVSTMPYLRLPEFIIGIVVSLELVAVRNFLSRWNSIFINWLLVVVFCTALLRPFGIQALLNHGILDLVFVVAIVRAAGLGKDHPLCNKSLVLLGEASYSLYLLQAPVIYFFTVAFKRLNLLSGLETSLPLQLSHSAGVVVATIMGSLVAYKFVELPAKSWLIQLWSQRQDPSP